jgi:hypothetical protein
MPLSSSALSSDLQTVFADISPDVTARKKADAMAMAIHTYVMSGKPMCILVTLPGPPGAITGTGMGGIDKPVPGTGLLLPILISKITSGYQISTDMSGAADKLAGAIHTYFSQAMIMTMDSNGAVPSITGVGGVDKPVPGMGYAAAKSILADDFYAIFSDVGPGGDMMSKVTQLATAIHSFCQQGMVKTDGTFAAPPLVPPPMFGPGAGISQGEFS